MKYSVTEKYATNAMVDSTVMANIPYLDSVSLHPVGLISAAIPVATYMFNKAGNNTANPKPTAIIVKAKSLRNSNTNILIPQYYYNRI